MQEIFKSLLLLFSTNRVSKSRAYTLLYRKPFNSYCFEIFYNLFQDVTLDPVQKNLTGLMLGGLTGAGQHGLDGARNQSVLPLDDELVAVGRDELDVHGLGALAAPVDTLGFIVGGHDGGCSGVDVGLAEETR